MTLTRKFLAVLALASGLAAVPMAEAQQKTEITVSRAFGLIYLATDVIEKQQLIEKEAAKLGIPDLKVKWVTFSGGGAQTDALLAGNVDVVNSGVGNLLLLWDRTKGGVKGIVGTSAQPLIMISRDPRIKSLRDFGPTDKIAVPTVKVSTHAVLIEMAAAQLFGPDQWARLDPNTVQMSHPDAVAALANPRHEMATHFSAPPYSSFEMKNIPGAHVIISSTDIIGGPLSQAQYFTTTKFADANPKIVEAIVAATRKAVDFIHSDTRAAVEIYRDITHDKNSTDELLGVLKEPGMMNYGVEPHGTLKLAEHLYKIGTLKTRPKAWTDYYLPVIHGVNGS